MESTIIARISEVINSENSHCNEHGYCQHRRKIDKNITDKFTEFCEQFPELLVIGRYCLDCNTCFDACFGGIPCTETTVRCTTRGLIHDTLKFRFHEEDRWHTLITKAYRNVNLWWQKFDLGVTFYCDDCGEEVNSFTLYIDFICDVNIFDNSEILKELTDRVKTARDKLLEDYHDGIHLPYEGGFIPEGDYLEMKIKFPYMNMCEWLNTEFKNRFNMSNVENLQVSNEDNRCEKNLVMYKLHQ